MLSLETYSRLYHRMSPPPTSGKPGGADNILVIVIIISVGAFTIIVVVVGAFLCTRRTTSHQKKYSVPLLMCSMLFPSLPLSHPTSTHLFRRLLAFYIWGVGTNTLSLMSHFKSAALNTRTQLGDLFSPVVSTPRYLVHNSNQFMDGGKNRGFTARI